MSAVSYSKEYKLRTESEVPFSFAESLGETGALIRDIVSDADKIEAIGEIGVERCMEYAREYMLKTNHRHGTEAEINAYLISHAQDKLLFLLRHNYIRTSIGKDMAKPHHNKMIDIICDKLGENEEQIAKLNLFKM
jgi:HD superfamily phosphodiesterase